MMDRIDSFERTGFVIEFIAEGRSLSMVINGKLYNNHRHYDTKAQMLAAWIIDTLKIPVVSYNSWKAIDAAMTVHGYILAPAFAQKRGSELHSFYVISSSAPIPVLDWPSNKVQGEKSETFDAKG